MVKSIEELNFDEKMVKLISNVEIMFNELAKDINLKTTMFEYICEDFKEIEEFKGLTDREKFLISFGGLSATLQERYEEIHLEMERFNNVISPKQQEEHFKQMLIDIGKAREKYGGR